VCLLKDNGCWASWSWISVCGFVVDREEGRKEERKGVSCVDFVSCHSLVGAWRQEIVRRVDDEQPKPATERPKDAY
jgi:hypothetical protein